jgi:hypothetical protein
MTKTTREHVDFRGKSGTSYRYWVLEESEIGQLPAVAGNYIFAKMLPTGAYLPVYVGETEDLSERLPDHERRMEALFMAAPWVLAHPTQDARARIREEYDLIRFWNPVLNVQHRTAG